MYCFPQCFDTVSRVTQGAPSRCRYVDDLAGAFVSFDCHTRRYCSLYCTTSLWVSSMNVQHLCACYFWLLDKVWQSTCLHTSLVIRKLIHQIQCQWSTTLQGFVACTIRCGTCGRKRRYIVWVVIRTRWPRCDARQLNHRSDVCWDSVLKSDISVCV